MTQAVLLHSRQLTTARALRSRQLTTARPLKSRQLKSRQKTPQKVSLLTLRELRKSSNSLTVNYGMKNPCFGKGFFV